MQKQLAVSELLSVVHACSVSCRRSLYTSWPGAPGLTCWSCCSTCTSTCSVSARVHHITNTLSIRSQQNNMPGWEAWTALHAQQGQGCSSICASLACADGCQPLVVAADGTCCRAEGPGGLQCQGAQGSRCQGRCQHRRCAAAFLDVWQPGSWAGQQQ
jgi:hypothetical protein